MNALERAPYFRLGSTLGIPIFFYMCTILFRLFLCAVSTIVAVESEMNS